MSRIPMNKQVVIYRVLAVILPVVLLVASLIILNISKDKIKGFQSVTANIISKNKTIEEASSFNTYLNANSIAIDKMNVAIPSESMLVGVIQDIEAVIRQYEPSASIKFAAVTPAKLQDNLIVPLTITANIPLTELPKLYQDLFNLPYILQVISSESRLNEGVAATLITLRLYVQDPFTGY